MISDLIKPHIRTIAPYKSARDLYAKAAGVLLDANENPLGSVLDGDYSGLSLNRYPDPKQRDLRESLGKYLSVPVDKLFFGVGSDEIIDLVMRLFCSPERDSVLIVEPTYGMYQTVADIQNVRTNICLLNDDFTIDPARVLGALSTTDRIIFLCSPNNPTGNLLDKSAIELIAGTFNGIVVVDEAYIDFAHDNASAVSLLQKYNNVVILRTFSKAWGLAAVRCGYTIADPEIISYLFKIKAPYSINVLTEHAILTAMNRIARKDNYVKEILAQRELLVAKLKTFDFIEEIFPTDANYLLIRLQDARKIHKELMDEGVIIRDRSSQPLLENCLRITVGTADENEKLLRGLELVASRYYKIHS